MNVTKDNSHVHVYLGKYGEIVQELDSIGSLYCIVEDSGFSSFLLPENFKNTDEKVYNELFNTKYKYDSKLDLIEQIEEKKRIFPSSHNLSDIPFLFQAQVNMKYGLSNIKMFGADRIPQDYKHLSISKLEEGIYLVNHVLEGNKENELFSQIKNKVQRSKVLK